MEKKWKVFVDELQHEIRIKGDDNLQRPIASIARPMNDNWMENESHFEKAIEKAKLVASAPELLQACEKLIQQIEMSDYSEPDGHHLLNNAAVYQIRKAIEKATK